MRVTGFILTCWVGVFSVGLAACSKSESSNLSAAVIPTDPVVLSGNVRYQDRIYSEGGFSGAEPYKPVRFAIVDLLDSDGKVQQSTATDAQGNFTFAPQTVGAYTLSVLAKTAPDSGYDVEVHRQTGELYAITMAVPLESAAESIYQDVTIALTSQVAGAFNILDVFIAGQAFTHHMSPALPALPTLKAYWSDGNATGTYTCPAYDSTYCRQGEGIYILGGYYGDRDEYDDDVLWHEYVHYLEQAFGGHETPGGPHDLTANTLDLRLAWSEGHANYLQAAIKAWLLDNDPARLSTRVGLPVSYYIDTVDSGVFLAVDFADMTTLPCLVCAFYSSSETAIANVLWSFKGATGAQTNWDVFAAYLTDNATPDTLEAFWDGLMSHPSTDQVSWGKWQTALIDRSIYYRLDSYEADDTASASATRTLDCTVGAAGALPHACLSAEEHYLFSGLALVDTDIIGLNLTAGASYHIYTHALKNGADTILRLFDATGNVAYDSATLVAIENDDAFDCEIIGTCVRDLVTGILPYHDGTNFSSKLQFVAPQDGTYYLEVSTAPAVYADPDRYGYIGRYGSYSLTVELTAVP